MIKNTSSPTKRVSAVAVVDLANELHHLAVIDDAYLRTMGAEFAALNATWKEGKAIQEQRLPEHLLLGLWAEANRAGVSTYIGLNIGSKVNKQARGLLANWLFQCSTLAEAFETFSNNIHLLNPSEHWERVNDTNQIKLRVRFKSDDYPLIAIDRSMAAIVSWGSSLIGSDIKAASASFTRSKPNCRKPYEDIFGKNIQFNQKENTLFFPNEIFNKPIEAANPYLKALLEMQSREVSSPNKASASTTERVRALLSDDLSRFCQIESVCQALHLSRSTLYRKLKAEGTSYTKQVKSARIAKLKHIQDNARNDSDITAALGFQDNGSYYRFRKTISES